MSRRSGWLALVVALGTVLPATVAWGHASGELPHARLSSSGHEVFLQWTAPADDAADVGVAVGLLPEEAVVAYLGGPAEDYPTEQEIQTLSASAELRAYLLDNVQVQQDGRACDAEVDPAENFLAEGARFVFTCPDPVEHALIRVTMLHDRDELYATYSVDGTVQYAVHTVGHPEHLWDFTLAASERPTVEPALLVGGIVVLVVLAGGVRYLSPRPRRREQEA